MEEAGPKKSKPSRESPVLLVFGFAEEVFLGGALWFVAGAAELDLCAGVGSERSPNRSTSCCGFWTGGEGLLKLEAARCDVERSSLAFSWTTFKG